MLCPLCHRADAIERDGYISTARTEEMSVRVTVPDKVCGRCGLAIANTAVIAAFKRWTEMRERG